jgi:hypothetical protein
MNMAAAASRQDRNFIVFTQTSEVDLVQQPSARLTSKILCAAARMRLATGRDKIVSLK